MKKTSPVTHVTKGSVFDDPARFPPDRGAELKMRAQLLRGPEAWLQTAGTQAAAAKVLGVTQARVSDRSSLTPSIGACFQQVRREPG